jgi:hypothetical protein
LAGRAKPTERGQGTMIDPTRHPAKSLIVGFLVHAVGVLFLLILLVAILHLYASCSFLVPCMRYASNNFSNLTSYRIHTDTVTAAGFRIDSSGYLLTHEYLSAVDDRLLEIEKCMQTVDPKLDPIDRDCFTIKLVEPVHSICSPEEEFLPVEAPRALCEDKGLEPNPECPCRWRTAVQDHDVLIVPFAPDPRKLNLWDTVRIHTGINNVWPTPFAKCAALGAY